jgi:hypothetical protein
MGPLIEFRLLETPLKIKKFNSELDKIMQIALFKVGNEL